MKSIPLLLLVLLLAAGGYGYWWSQARQPAEPVEEVEEPSLSRENLDRTEQPTESTVSDDALAAANADADRLRAIELNRDALAALRDDRAEDAVRLLQQALELSPEDPVMALNLSRSYVRLAIEATGLGRHQDALDLLALANDTDTDHGYPASWMARVYLRTGDRVEARAVLQKALAEFPEQATLLRLSADLAALEGDIQLAVAQISQAVLLQPEDAYLVERQEQLVAEEELYRTFLTDATAHFESRYDPQDPDMVQWIPELQADLEDAWSEVVRGLGIQPQQRILVMWLDPERYKWRAPDWSSGLYDGRVRIVIDNYPQQKDAIRRTLRHELTHAVLHTVGTRIPTWLHEGMAQMMEGRPVDLAHQALEARLPLLLQPADLDGNWTGWSDTDKVAQAYFYSMLLSDWLTQEYGTNALPNLFQNLRGTTWEEGWSRTFGADFAEVEARFRAGWDRS